MKKFEYMDDKKWREIYSSGRYQSYNDFLNSMGAQGWEIIPDPGSHGYLYKREITEEPSAARKLQ